MVSISAFQAEGAGSIPATCSIADEDFPESLGVMNQAVSNHVDVAK